MPLFGPPDVEKLKAKGDVPGLIKALLWDENHFEDHWRLHQEVAQALVQIGARAVEPLVAALGDRRTWVRSAAVRALGQIGDARAVEPLIVALTDADETVRYRAAEALGQIGDARATGPLTVALKDEHEGVRPAAAAALKKLDDATHPEEEPSPPARATGRPQEPAARPESSTTGRGPAAPPQAAGPARTASGPGADARVVRVFVSSTFRDMAAERDELVKNTFPALRKLCESRGVTWGEVDLRWGVTNEQKAEGQVLPICLAEIRGCRPYFIGLLGERYGWVPDALDPALVEREPWLSAAAGRSVTELEILHGVLNDQAMAEHTFFYLRAPAYVKGKPPDQFREVPTADEIASLGPQEAEHRATERQARLAALKERIRSSGLPVREDYPDPRALGEAVLADLTPVIDRLYPEGSEPDALAREAAEHDAFARSRAGVYIGRPEYFDRLDAHAGGDGPPLVVLGESGSGKSALLANWVRSYRATRPDAVVLAHFIGASAASADWAAMLRRVIGELSRRLELGIEIPDQADALRVAFANTLHQAAARSPFVLVLDALNQLEDREGALDLAWLPPAIPANVRLILSTLPGRAFAELQKRNYPTLEIAALEPAERERLIIEYLASYTKALDAGPRQRIAAAPQCANPLYLRALLDELRLWGEHETLGQRIDHYLAAPSVDALFERILARYEADYERDRPGLVRDAFSLLWAARRGLSETELLDLLGSGGEPLPRAYWSPLFLATDSSLTSHSGLLGFFHDYLREAVQNLYLPAQPMRQRAHLRLAGYFEAQTEQAPRRNDELPWQLVQASEWGRLNDLLGDLDFYEALWEFNPYDTRAYWTQLEAHSPHRMVDGYRRVVDHPARYSDHVWSVASLLEDAGHIDEASSLRAFLVEHHRTTGNRPELGRSLINQGKLLSYRGDLDAAMLLFEEAESIAQESGDREGVAGSLDGQAGILYGHGDLDGAMALQKKAERICRELGDKAGLGSSLGNQSFILRDRGELDGAMSLHQEAERIFRELGDRSQLGKALGNQANLLARRGDLDGAMALHKEDEQICRELGDKAGLGSSLGNQATILDERGDHDGALALFREVERIVRELGDRAGLQTVLGNQGMILKASGALDAALKLHQEQERICRELGDRSGLQIALGNQANILKARGNLQEALSLYRERERICRELGNTEDLAIALMNQALTLAAMKNTAEAHSLADESLRLAQGIGYDSLVQQISSMRSRWGI